MVLKEIGREEFRLDASGSGWGPVAGPFEYDNEPSGSIRNGEFLNYLSEYQLLKNNLAPYS